VIVVSLLDGIVANSIVSSLHLNAESDAALICDAHIKLTFMYVYAVCVSLLCLTTTDFARCALSPVTSCVK
jgi:hypothetical protein